jgi:hypothetical protein
MKLCKDCRWVGHPHMERPDPLCMHSSSRFQRSPNYYDGTAGGVEQLSCNTVRSTTDERYCGPEATFWETWAEPVRRHPYPWSGNRNE